MIFGKKMTLYDGPYFFVADWMAYLVATQRLFGLRRRIGWKCHRGTIMFGSKTSQLYM